MAELVTVVIPVYKTSSTLSPLTGRIQSALASLGMEFEVIFVDDGGDEESWLALGEVHRKHKFVRVFRLARNFGQHNAILCGVCKARGDLLVTMDDDLQHPPEMLPTLLAALKPQTDVVYGSPRSANHGFLRNVASKLTKLVLQQTMGAETASHASAFRVFRKSLVENWAGYKGPLVNIDVMLTWVTNRFDYVLVEHHQRVAGKSGYTLRTLLKHALNLITGFTNLPLQVASVTGIVFSAFGFFVLVYVVLGWLLRGSAVPGFAFLASIISIFSGIQLLAVGIMGEYISRMFERLSEKPKYVVRDSLEQVKIS